MCHILRKDLAEGEVWGAYDGKNAFGDGCRLCMETAVEGWPEYSWAVLCDKCSEDSSMKLEFKGARVLKKGQGIGKGRFNPPSSVSQSRSRMQTIFSDLGFVTETELQRILGGEIGGKALKMKEGEVPLEDRPGTLKGYYISLQGLPLDILLSIRKVRTSFSRELVHAEERLQPQNQIRQEQGDAFFNYFTEKHTNAIDSAARTINRSKVYTLENLRKRADEILQDHQLNLIQCQITQVNVLWL